MVMRNESGQAMVFTIVIVMGALIGATVIAGSIMIRQIRQSVQSIDSTKAIFAAETGIELELYRAYKDPTYPAPVLVRSEATYNVSVLENIIKSVGKSRTSSRALQLTLTPLP